MMVVRVKGLFRNRSMASQCEQLSESAADPYSTVML